MQKPSNEDCCGSGCNPCIFDVYEKSLKNVQPTQQVLNPTKYLPFLVKNVEQLCEDTFLYTFTTLDEKPSPIALKMTNYAIIRGEGFSRPYTIISNDFLKIGCFQFIIRLYPNGKMSEKLRKVSIGDTLFLRGPYSHFNYKKTSHILLIGSGTGILPLYNITKSLTSDETCETYIHIIGCFQTLEKILLRKDFQDLSKFWNCSVEYFIQESTETPCLLYREKVTFHKLDNSSLRHFFSTWKTIVCCGSDGFNRFVQDVAGEFELNVTVL